MQLVLQQLGQLLFDSIPTIILFVLLHYYLKGVLYRPLQETLRQRSERIEGRLEAARKLVEQAEQKLAGYEAALRARRVENYKQVEARRQAALTLGQQRLAQARHDSAQNAVQARVQLAAQTGEARRNLQASADMLAGQIVSQVFAGNAGRPAAAPGAGA
jgi:F0F1-type ATP synthase membrane subunit b/b'